MRDLITISEFPYISDFQIRITQFNEISSQVIITGAHEFAEKDDLPTLKLFIMLAIVICV
jgi:hypothetical protein